MDASGKMVLWTDEAAMRYFLIPEGEKPVAGALLIMTLSGQTQSVDGAWAKGFEVTAEEAQSHYRTKLGG